MKQTNVYAAVSRRYAGRVLIALCLVVVFFASLLLLSEEAFERVWNNPDDADYDRL